MRAYQSLAAAFVLGICALGAHARAQSAADKAKATSLFKQGIADMEAGKFDDGCPKIEQSLQLDHQPGTLFTLAECNAGLDRLKTAIDQYNEYLAWYDKMTPAQQGTQGKRQLTAQQQVAKLASQMPELTLTLPANAPSGTVVTLDDDVVQSSKLGRPQQVNPGVHLVTTKAPGGQVTKIRVMLGKGAKQQVTLAVSEGSAPPSSSAAPPAASASSSAAPPAPPASASSSATPPRPPPSSSSAAPPPHPPASSSAAPPSPPPSAPPPPSSAVPPPPSPPPDESLPGVPRVHIEAKQPVTLVLMGGNAPRAINQPACQAPCDQLIDGRAGQSFFIAGEGITDSSPFQLRGKSGTVNVHVDPGSRPVRTGGIALTTMGTLGTLVGGPILIVGASSAKTGAEAAGGVLLGVGVSALAIGIVMIVQSGTNTRLSNGSIPGVIRF